MSQTFSKPVLIGGFVVLAVVGAALPMALDYVADCVFSPWAHSFRGEPTLTGHWRGELVYSAQGKRRIHLEIRHEPRPNGYGQAYYARRGRFDGVAEITSTNGYRTRYEVWGRANRSGSEIHFQFRALNRQSVAVPQPHFNELNGVWRGQTLELTGTYEMDVFHNGSSTWNSDWPGGTVAAVLSH